MCRALPGNRRPNPWRFVLHIAEAWHRTMSEKNVISNQKQILKNQKSILRNQSHIRTNQETIKKNQAAILKNQSSLDTILENQKEILALLKK
jgi:hypothetical protein